MTAITTHVGQCTIAGCSYNHEDECNAGAVTIAGGAKCATFIPLTVKGGLPRVIAEVGACHRGDCTFNHSLECSAPTVKVGPGADGPNHPGCLTFQAA